MRPHYIGHDGEYGKRRAAGHAGWETEEGVGETIADLKAMLRSAHVPAQGRLLELGCGAGDQSLWLATLGYEVCGVDIAPTAIAWAQEKARERGLAADFRVGDVLTLEGFPEAAFDIVLDGRCFHCIIGADRPRFLAAARRALKPGGVFHLATMCGDPVPEGVKPMFDPVSRCTVSGDIATRYFGTPDSLLSEIRAAGFVLLDSRVRPSEGPDDQSMLFVNATLPSPSPLMTM